MSWESCSWSSSREYSGRSRAYDKYICWTDRLSWRCVRCVNVLGRGVRTAIAEETSCFMTEVARGSFQIWRLEGKGSLGTESRCRMQRRRMSFWEEEWIKYVDRSNDRRSYIPMKWDLSRVKEFTQNKHQEPCTHPITWCGPRSSGNWYPWCRILKKTSWRLPWALCPISTK